MAAKRDQQRQDSALLSPVHYDDDATSLHSDQDTDSEDDEVIKGARSSREIREHDRRVLDDEEETDRILTQERSPTRRISVPAPIKNLFGKAYSSLPSKNEINGRSDGESRTDDERRERRRQRRARRQERKERLMSEASNGEDRGLMYEMEEGGMKDGSETGDSSETEGSSEIDRRGLQKLSEDKNNRRSRFRKFVFVHLLIILFFAIIGLGAWRLSMDRAKTPEQKTFHNGTSLFAPTTILISLDGFRADFLNRGLTPRLQALIEEGVSPVYMLPSFPSVTFPNHWTIATGLYPEAHGVVGNSFWDPNLQAEFYYTDPARSLDAKWWGGEPIWVTAEKQGIRTAIHMWPGSEVHDMEIEPSFVDKYNGKESLDNKVKRVLELLDKPGQEDDNVLVDEMRPQFIAAYVPNVDTDGHLYGPNSTEIRTTISNVDNMLDKIFAGLEERNLTDVVNVVVVSDHGMATTDTSRLIQLDDIIDMSMIEHTDGFPLYGLRPKDPADLQGLYDKLAAEATANPNFEVYLRDVNMPERYHFSQNDRIAPLWMVPKTGWAIVTKKDFDVEHAKANNIVYHPRGLHGYDHEHPLMRAIFVARGPAFPHKPNSRVEVFQNTEVYNIICDSLHLVPRPNNGTLRLPLKPIGLHSPETTPEAPVDPPQSANPADVATPTAAIDAGGNLISISPTEASSAADPNVVPPTVVGVNDPTPSEDDEQNDGGETGTDLGGRVKQLWDEFVGTIKGFGSWVGGLVSGGKGESPNSGEGSG